MNHPVVFAFVLIISSVAGQEALQSCIIVANTMTQLNPESTCAYTEDAVRCGINNLGLAKDNATEQEIENYRDNATDILLGYNCSVKFDDIFSAVKAERELLELQGCIDTAMEKNVQDPKSFWTCDLLFNVTWCDIRSLKLYEEDVSADLVKSTRSFVNSQLSDLNCEVPFDDILKEVKENPEKLVQECNSTTEEGFQQQACDYVKNSSRCVIRYYEFYKDVPPNDYLMYYRASQDVDFSNHRCNTTFDDILKEVKANRELLEDLPGCPELSDQDQLTTCDRIEEGVRCGIRALKIDKDEASDEEVMYGKEVASRYLAPYRCKKTFDVLLKEEKKRNKCSTVSPVGWLTAVMVAFIVMFTVV